MSRLPDDLRRLADAFESAAAPEAAVVARIGARQRTRRVLAPALAAMAAVVVLLLGASIRGLLTSPNPGPPVMPSTTGLFRSLQPDAEGWCFAVRLYDTTVADGRVAQWAWTGTDGCDARTSNLFENVGTATALWLPAVTSSPIRAGIRVDSAIGITGPQGPSLRVALRFVLDPAAAGATDVIPGFWSLAEIAGDHTVTFQRVDVLDVPYVVP